ncbi:MAG: Gldg family protein [Candidatus Riflebacteria bacterium]|nr:Gldg family protein [Candidatus Riflebacteria bacterium]
MNSKRIESGYFAVTILLLGVVIILASGVAWLMYPSRGDVALWILVAGAGFAALSFIIHPKLLRDIVTSRRTLLWINDAFLILAIIGIGLLLGVIAARRHYRYDFTRDSLFSVSDSTKKVLVGLSKEVKVTAFFPKGSVEGALVEDLLSEYRRYTDKVQFKMIDPFRDPLTTKAMNISNAGTVVVQCEVNRKDISPNELFQQANRYMQQQSESPKFQGEQAITSAVVNVTSGTKRKILFVTGHEEPRISSYNSQGLAGIQQYLTKENYEVGEISLMENIPTDTAVLAIFSPKKDFHETEIKALTSFVKDQKKNLLIALDPDNKAEQLDSFLVSNYGVVPNKDIIINPSGIGNDPSLVIPTYEMHQIVKVQMEAKSGVLMQLCRSISFEKKDPWQITAFLRTSPESYAKRDSNEVMSGKIEFTQGKDARGPLNLGLAIEGTGNASGSRAVILGDADFASNKLLQVQGNSDLIVNAINWLAGQEQMISIRPKTLDFGTVTIDRDSGNFILILTMLVSPMVIFLIGGAVWWTRRRV